MLGLYKWVYTITQQESFYAVNLPCFNKARRSLLPAMSGNPIVFIRSMTSRLNALYFFEKQNVTDKSKPIGLSNLLFIDRGNVEAKFKK